MEFPTTKGISELPPPAHPAGRRDAERKDTAGKNLSLKAF